MAAQTKIDPAKAVEEAERRAARAAELKAARDDKRAKLEGESKSDAFKRIAARRTNTALDEIAKLAPLSNVATYEYTDDQTAKIIAALKNAIGKVETAFANKGVAKAGGGFDL